MYSGKTSKENNSSESSLNRTLIVELLEDEMTTWELYGYSLVLPLICLVGIVANSLSLVVLIHGHLKESLYTYLTGEPYFVYL